MDILKMYLSLFALAALVASASVADKPVDANGFVAELNGLLAKYKLPSKNLVLGDQQAAEKLADANVPLKPKDVTDNKGAEDKKGEKDKDKKNEVGSQNDKKKNEWNDKKNDKQNTKDEKKDKDDKKAQKDNKDQKNKSDKKDQNKNDDKSNKKCENDKKKEEEIKISKQEFHRALRGNNFKKQPEQYQNFLDSLKKAHIANKREAAMYLAHLIYESDGLQVKEDTKCKSAQAECTKQYAASGGIGEQGKVYMGRGFLKVHGALNYHQASQDLYGDESLVKAPEKAASDDKTAWDLSAWYWSTYVHKFSGVVEKGLFGVSTFAQTQGAGCVPAEAEAKKKRNSFYQVVFKAFNLEGTPNTDIGC